MGNGKGKKILGGVLSFASGLIGLKSPVVGLAKVLTSGVKDQAVKFLDKNKASEVGGEGKNDWAGLVGAIVSGIILIAIIGVGLYLLLTGKITMDEFIELEKKVN